MSDVPYQRCGYLESDAERLLAAEITDRKAAVEAARKAAGGEGSDLFAEREKQGKAAVRTRDFEQLSKEQHAVKVERQAKPNCARLTHNMRASKAPR